MNDDNWEGRMNIITTMIEKLPSEIRDFSYFQDDQFCDTDRLSMVDF